MTELELHRGASLSEQMNFARLVADGSILPESYRRNPANVLIAVGLGQAMGLSPAESLYRIAVIKGKPTAGAELIAANVRKAGHKLRVITDEQGQSVKAVIIRADDPDFPHEVVRDMAWAQSMGLDRNDNYKKQPLTMLQWRAITAVARLAAPEALYGVAYTADEMFDSAGGPSVVAAQEADAPPVITVEQIHEPEETGEAMQDKTRRQMFALFTQKGVEEADQLAGINHLCATAYESRGDLTEADAQRVIAMLKSRPDVELGAQS